MNCVTKINSLSHYIIAVMTLTMNLPQSEKLIHSNNEWWWPLYHIAPVLAKEQNDNTSLSAGWSGPTAQQGHHAECHTYKGAEILGCFKKRVVGGCWTWLKLAQHFKWLPPKFYPVSGYSRCLCLSPISHDYVSLDLGVVFKYQECEYDIHSCWRPAVLYIGQNLRVLRPVLVTIL